MNKTHTKRIAINGAMIAMVFLATYFTKIPIPATQGYFNLGDTVIMVAAMLLGRGSGLLAGALGSLLADVVGGFFIFAPLTFVVKGLEGFIVGSFASLKGSWKSGWLGKALAVIAGALTMVAGYFIGEAYILSIFDKAFGYTVAVVALPVNLLQGGISALIAYMLSAILRKAGKGIEKE